MLFGRTSAMIKEWWARLFLSDFRAGRENDNFSFHFQNDGRLSCEKRTRSPGRMSQRKNNCYPFHSDKYPQTTFQIRSNVSTYARSGTGFPARIGDAEARSKTTGTIMLYFFLSILCVFLLIRGATSTVDRSRFVCAPNRRKKSLLLWFTSFVRSVRSEEVQLFLSLFLGPLGRKKIPIRSHVSKPYHAHCVFREVPERYDARYDHEYAPSFSDYGERSPR